MRQDIRNYNDEPDFNNSYTKNSYNDFELPENDFAVEEDNYTQFVNPQKAIARSYRERISRYDYLKDLESPFMQNIHIPLRKDVSPRWLAKSDKKNFCEIHDTDIQSGERKKRTKVLSKPNRNFNCKAELEHARDIAMYREQDNLPNVVDPVVPSKQMFWDFISFENDSECEGTTFYTPTKTKNHSGLQKMAPLRKRSYIFNSQPNRIVVVDSEGEEFNETIKKNSRENLSPKIPINSERYRTSKSDTMKEQPKILQLNTPNMNSSRGQSTRTSVDEQILNMYFTAKDSTNMSPRLATEEKKNKFLTTERKEEIINTTDDNRRYYNKFVNKLSNNSPKKTDRLTRIFNRITDSSSNGRIEMENERDKMNSHRENIRNSKMDQIDVTVSRLTPEKITQNEKIFALKMRNTSVPRLDVKKEKERKFFSRLPIRTWKRFRTKEPITLHPESDKDKKVENETALNNHPKKTENDDVHTKDRATTINSNDIKQSEHFETGSLS
ncbi:hypothetical protein G5I_02117 [Acromyrmex echinatior]|uniref:Uncharacterized protein n=1 Tax=Acromyrmex echinatior TaxID=103372 RepID=F4W9G5_ACREC|nr:hypothetical protein G5I_02117 [Acromyrmex echinatior]